MKSLKENLKSQEKVARDASELSQQDSEVTRWRLSMNIERMRDDSFATVSRKGGLRRRRPITSLLVFPFA